jgi:DNA-binding MarR family transcriptional regulator
MADDIRWLDDDEQATWRSYLEATRLVFDRVEGQLQHEAGLPHTYYEILVRLSEEPQRQLRMSELADRALSSRSRLSHAVNRLVELGWVERRECPTDRRGQIAALTAQGMKVLESAAPGHVETVRSTLFDPLSAEQVAQLRTISETLAAATSRCPAEDRADIPCPGETSDEPGDCAGEPTLSR